MDLSILTTEQRNPNTRDLDLMTSLEIVTAINREDAGVPAAIAPCLPMIAALVDRIVEAFQRGDRLIYIGAGTSGRLGVLDASECPPTYGVPPEQVIGLIAGGDWALRHSVEGAEDDPEQGATDVRAIGLNARDVLVGIAASGRTPYTLGAMRYGREAGAIVGCIVNTPGSEMARLADYPIVILSGPEVVTGSTRMKSGTAQKLVLNMLSTAAMVRLGKVYSNLMVDVQASNAKLIQRAANIVREVTGVDPAAARQAIDRYGSAKVAIFALLSGFTDGDVARAALAAHGGRLREALATATGCILRLRSEKDRCSAQDASSPQQ
jgi:N-acetylmuramic acid 6-phosphate etherase